MKFRVRVKCGFEFRAVFEAQWVLQHFGNVISSNFGAKTGDKQRFKPFRLPDDRQ
jgi:hypothetical protein